MRVATAAAVAAGLFAAAQAGYNPGVPETNYALEVDQAMPAPNPNGELTYTEAFAGQHNCQISLHKPEKPRSLSFCHKFNDLSCCVPAMDDENIEMFNLLTGSVLGLSCRLRGDIREDPLAKFYCMNCDPEQPRYVRPFPWAGVDGNPGGGRAVVLLISKAWAFDGFGVDPILAGPKGRFKECGLKKSSPCLDIEGNPIPDRDRYTCGDDYVVPSDFTQSDDSGAVDPVASIEAFMNADSMGPPVIDEGFGFYIVNDAPCKDSELVTAYQDVTSAAAQQPRCLRTQDQLIRTTYTFVGGAKTYNDTTFRDFFCANGFGLELDEENAGYFAKEDCKDVRPNGDEVVGSEADKCSDAVLRASHPCCCGAWLAEKAFNSASGLAPVGVAALLAVAVAAALF